MRLYYPLVSESGLPGGGQDDTSFFSWRAIFPGWQTGRSMTLCYESSACQSCCESQRMRVGRRPLTHTHSDDTQAVYTSSECVHLRHDIGHDVYTWAGYSPLIRAI